jgi:hypothetical protein
MSPQSLCNPPTHSKGELTVRRASPGEEAGWDQLVASFENRRIYHKRAWIQAIANSSTVEPLYLVFERNGAVVACQPGFLLKLAVLKIYASPFEGSQTESMGPVFDPSAVSADELMNVLVPFLEKQCGVHQIEIASRVLTPETMSSLGFEGTVLFTYRAPLIPGDEGATLAHIDKKTRNQMRKAVKVGLISRVEEEESFVEEFYDQVREVFARRGNAVPFGRNRVLQYFRELKKSNNLLAVSVWKPDENKCIATGLFTIEGSECCLWGWAHRTQYRWFCPNELLTWTAMQKAMEAGCVILDLAGGGDAKLKFGAAPDRCNHRWIRSRFVWLSVLRQTARWGYRRQQALRGWLARWQGQVLRRR